MAETYKLLPVPGVQRLSDGAFVPEDERNADWREYLAWVADGNAAYAADYEAPAGETQPTAASKKRT